MTDINKLLCRFGIELNDTQESQFLQYEALLLEWNKKVNLTAITEHNDILVKHFADSISIAAVLSTEKFNNSSVIDIGTGAGFPGIPLKIVFPAISRMTLLDSLNKRVNFLKELAARLMPDQTGIECVHMRAEDAAHNPAYRECYDLAVSRAVAPLNVLVEYALPFVRPGGFFIAYKGANAALEAETAINAITELGGRLSVSPHLSNSGTLEQGGIVKVKLSGDITHSLIVIRKLRHTALKYPRSPAKIAKSPLN